MTASARASDERARLEALRTYGILDAAPEVPFDDVAALAAAIADTPMAAVTFIDEERQWFMASIGVPDKEGPRHEAFCAHTIQSLDSFVVEDACGDVRFVTNPAVTGPMHLRSYAGAPIVVDGGLALGAVAVFDTRPRRFDATQLDALRRLALVAVRLLEERRQRLRVVTLTADRRDALVRSHELMLSHLDNTPLAVIEWDEAFRVRRWTRSAEAMFGWAEREVVGKHPEAWTFVHPDDAAAVDEIMQELIEQRAPRNVSRNRNMTHDGRVRTCDWYNSVVPVPHGGTSILSLIDDVTETIERGRRAQASQRLESLGQLTGGVAHDFNNLLTVIAGNADLLGAEHTTPEQARRLVQMISDASERGAALTRSLLAFARRQPLSPTVCDVDVLIKGLLPILERTLQDAVVLEVRTSGSLPRTASVDAHAFESALLNLVLNARDAQPQGGRVLVSSKVETIGPAEAEGHGVTPGPYVVTTVEDAGVGVAPELQDRVWEPFFTTKRSGEGSGMGLPMVYGFARQSRGFTRLRSIAGRGTTVTLALPWIRAEPEARRQGPSDVVGGTEHVLVVDDNELVRELVGTQLEALGYRVTTLGDGRSALAFLDTDPTVELLLSDVVMPGGMGGYDLAYEVQRRRPDVAIVLMSGYDGGIDGGASSAQRPDAPRFDLLEKPYRREVLAARLRAALRRAT